MPDGTQPYNRGLLNVIETVPIGLSHYILWAATAFNLLVAVNGVLWQRRLKVSYIQTKFLLDNWERIKIVPNDKSDQSESEG